MPHLRTGLTALSASICSFVLVHAVSCGTDAVGVEDCREIESARCEAAAACQGDLHVEDVDACKRYYRDHCLHGLAADDSPGGPFINGCVAAIEAAGDCAAADPDMSVADCVTDPLSGGRLHDVNLDRDLPSVCDIVQYPERTWECEFLAPQAPVAPTPDAGEDPGSAGGAGTTGAGGAGG